MPVMGNMSFGYSSGGSESQTGDSGRFDPPPEAIGCYVSVGNPPVDIYFGDSEQGLRFSEGPPTMFPFAEPMRWRVAEGHEGPATVSVLWVKLSFNGELKRRLLGK